MLRVQAGVTSSDTIGIYSIKITLKDKQDDLETEYKLLIMVEQAEEEPDEEADEEADEETEQEAG